MIAQNTLRVDHVGRDEPLYLAPFGVQEMSEVLPIDTAGLYFDKNYLKDIAAGGLSAEQYVSEEHTYPHGLEWGIYHGEISPGAFFGTVDMRPIEIGDPETPRRSTRVQEAGIFIMRPGERGKGLGSLVALAVISHTLQTMPETQMFKATPSANNRHSQALLSKIGFTYIDSYVHDDFPEGEETQLWMLATPDAQKELAESEAELNELEAGWQRYKTLLHPITLSEINA